MDDLAKEMTNLYRKGSLVSICRSTRLPPLEVPMKPEWFGLRSFYRVGLVSRRVSYRLSILSEDELRSVENKKNALSDLLRRFGFSLGDGQWWMPFGVRPLFEGELQRLDAEGLQQLQGIVGGDVTGFINSRRHHLLNDAEKLYREFHPNAQLPEAVATEILDAVGRRLDKTRSGHLLPSVAYSAVEFLPQAASEWAKPWSQALRLLVGIAEFPRRALTDPFFSRGLRVRQGDLIRAMDVLEDPLVSKWLSKAGDARDLEEQGYKELGLIHEIEGASEEDREKCDALLALVKGGRESGLLKRLGAGGSRHQGS